MLENILELQGVQRLKKSNQKKITGGFGLTSYCPSEGSPCYPGAAVICLTATPICLNEIWTYL